MLDIPMTTAPNRTQADVPLAFQADEPRCVEDVELEIVFRSEELLVINKVRSCVCGCDVGGWAGPPRNCCSVLPAAVLQPPYVRLNGEFNVTVEKLVGPSSALLSVFRGNFWAWFDRFDTICPTSRESGSSTNWTSPPAAYYVWA